MRQYLNGLESGKSMVEIIGVLIIIGVVTLTALLGYDQAMLMYRENETLDQYAKAVAGARTGFILEEFGDKTVSGGSYEAVRVPIRKIISSVQFDEGSESFTTPMGAQVFVDVETPKAFTAHIKGTTYNVCRKIVAADLGYDFAYKDTSGNNYYPMVLQNNKEVAEEFCRSVSPSNDEEEAILEGGDLVLWFGSFGSSSGSCPACYTYKDGICEKKSPAPIGCQCTQDSDCNSACATCENGQCTEISTALESCEKTCENGNRIECGGVCCPLGVSSCAGENNDQCSDVPICVPGQPVNSEGVLTEECCSAIGGVLFEGFCCDTTSDEKLPEKEPCKECCERIYGAGSWNEETQTCDTSSVVCQSGLPYDETGKVTPLCCTNVGGTYVNGICCDGHIKIPDNEPCKECCEHIYGEGSWDEETQACSTCQTGTNYDHTGKETQECCEKNGGTWDEETETCLDCPPEKLYCVEERMLDDLEVSVEISRDDSLVTETIPLLCRQSVCTRYECCKDGVVWGDPSGRRALQRCSTIDEEPYCAKASGDECLIMSVCLNDGRGDAVVVPAKGDTALEICKTCEYGKSETDEGIFPMDPEKEKEICFKKKSIKPEQVEELGGLILCELEEECDPCPGGGSPMVDGSCCYGSAWRRCSHCNGSSWGYDRCGNYISLGQVCCSRGSLSGETECTDPCATGTCATNFPSDSFKCCDHACCIPCDTPDSINGKATICCEENEEAICIQDSNGESEAICCSTTGDPLSAKSEGCCDHLGGIWVPAVSTDDYVSVVEGNCCTIETLNKKEGCCTGGTIWDPFAQKCGCPDGEEWVDATETTGGECCPVDRFFSEGGITYCCPEGTTIADADEGTDEDKLIQGTNKICCPTAALKAGNKCCACVNGMFQVAYPPQNGSSGSN